MRLKLSVLILVGLLFNGYAFSQDVKFTPVEPPKQTAWLGVTGITQDQQGYMWFATFNGLYKYDGHNYTIYNHESSNRNSLGSAELEDVYAGNDGMIWIATFGAGLDRLDPLTNTFTNYHHDPKVKSSIADNRVSSIIQGRDGTLWVGTNSGLEQFDPKTGLFKHFIHNVKDPGSLSNNQVRIIYEDREGTIWIGTGSVFAGDGTPKGAGGLNRLDRKTGKFTRYLHNDKDPNSLTDNRIQAIFEDSRGIFWVGSAGDGLHTMNRETGAFTRYPYDPKHPEKLSRPPLKNNPGFDGDHITFINEDVSGKIWIGTFLDGINVYDPKSQRTTWYGADPKTNVKIGKDLFWRAYRSHDGILWIGPWQQQDLYKINPYQNTLPHLNTGTKVFDFIEDSNYNLWVATDKGLIYQGRNSSANQFFYTDKNIPPGKDAIAKLERDDDDSIWLGTLHGLYHFDFLKKSFTGFHRQKNNKNGLLSDTVIAVKKRLAGKLWVGTDKGLSLMDTKTGFCKNFQTDIKDTTSISYNVVSSIEIDKNKNVWVATGSGLNRLDEKTMHFKRYLTGYSVYFVFSDSKNDLWCGSNKGLSKYDFSKDAFLSIDNETLSVYAAVEDNEGNLWLNTAVGIEKFNLGDKLLQIYGLNQGVNPQSVTNWGYKRHNGDILYGDTTGYFDFQPDKLLHQTPPPTISINSFLLGAVPVVPVESGILTRPVYETKEIKLNHSQSTFSFGFTSIDYINAAEDNHLYYILQNHDSGWLSAGMDGSANYFNVPPGNYIFKVKSVNTNGLVTEKQIAVIISPPWWQTLWAYTLFVLVFAGSIWGFIYYRSLSLIKEKRVLEHKVRVRTEEVLQQKEEIETQRDNLEKAFVELKSAQTQLIQSEKMASLGELTAGIAHEIQNPLNFVNNFSEVNAELIDEMKEEMDSGNLKEAKATADNIKENEQKINLHGKRADSIVKGMLEHSRSRSGQKEPTDLNVMADEYMRLSYHGLRAKDKSFNAELITRFDPALQKINVVQQDFGRVMLNLFNNAFYAVNQKQKTAGADYKPEVIVTTSTENGQVVIKVKDNGVGIPDAIKEKIMQPFFTTKPTGEGTGLGLSLTYDMVVKGHAGSIQVNSKEGEGSEFIITIPIS